jgi:quercetin dioxygenase-like cupin family protein
LAQPGILSLRCRSRTGEANDEACSKADPTERVSFAFPISGETGADSCTVGYAELPPDGAIQRHADSANELILVLEGTVEFEIGDETGTFGPARSSRSPRT